MMIANRCVRIEHPNVGVGCVGISKFDPVPCFGKSRMMYLVFNPNLRINSTFADIGGVIAGTSLPVGQRCFRLRQPDINHYMRCL